MPSADGIVIPQLGSGVVPSTTITNRHVTAGRRRTYSRRTGRRRANCWAVYRVAVIGRQGIGRS
jgi:hypothetical protein